MEALLPGAAPFKKIKIIDVKGSFRFMDLFKELRLIVYEFAFLPCSRRVHIRTFDEGYNVTRAMGPLGLLAQPPYPLLLASKTIYFESIGIFFDDT